MPKQEFPGAENIGSDFIPEGLGANSTSRAHHTVQRKFGYRTSRMTYLGLHRSAAGAERARQKHAAEYKNYGGDDDGASLAAAWLDSTEVVELAEGQQYDNHGDITSRIHGENDGAHGSKRLTNQELGIQAGILS